MLPCPPCGRENHCVSLLLAILSAPLFVAGAAEANALGGAEVPPESGASSQAVTALVSVEELGGSIEPVTIVEHESSAHNPSTLSEEQHARLAAAGWAVHAGDRPAVWVSVDEQMLRVIENGEIRFQATCATAKNGVGSEMDSLKTPLGWHSVAEKFGESAPWGQVFYAKRPTSQIWKGGEPATEDLVLTRILALAGEEPGLNQGGNVDSFARNIYIHGTNDEANLGVPSSHGCIRLSNDDVIKAFETIPQGAAVLITVREEHERP